VTPVDLAAGAKVLRRLAKEGYRSILVGGLAIEEAGFGGTKDVDALVRAEQFDGLEFLKGEGLLIRTATGTITSGELKLSDGTTIPFDLLNPAWYVGAGHTGEEFFAFVARTAKRKSYGLVANPGVVYYTRLLVGGPHGEAYLERMRRDLDAGAPPSWVNDALEIAARFGTVTKIRRKVQRVLRGI
jgi:hypothetical protein